MEEKIERQNKTFPSVSAVLLLWNEGGSAAAAGGRCNSI